MPFKSTLVLALAMVCVASAQDKLPTDHGLYYRSGDTHTKLQSSCSSGMKTHDLGRRDEFVYRNAQATFQLDNRHPTFVYVGTESSPLVRQQFLLGAMGVKKHERHIGFRLGGVMSNVLDLKITKKDLVSTVTPAADLNPGEYLLGVYEGASDATVGNFLACGFDFSVKP
jgi:hypothetical protein